MLKMFIFGTLGFREYTIHIESSRFLKLSEYNIYMHDFLLSSHIGET
jgi:hypothetical protein